MRESLGATKRERVLSKKEARQVVVVDDPIRGRRLLRRIAARGADGPDLVDQAIAVGLVRDTALPGFTRIEDRAIVGSTLEIVESYVDGLTLAAALDVVREEISVSVAISMVHEIAKGLELLHGIVEPSGRPASLVHGRLGLDQVMITATGDVFVIGLEGLRGTPVDDVRALLAMLHAMLVGKASSKAGSALLAKLAELEFQSAREMSLALSTYLKKQNDAEVRERRVIFASKVLARARPAVTEDAVPVFIPDTPTEQGRGAASDARPAAPAPTLGISAAVHIDDEEGDSPTVANGVSPLDERTLDQPQDPPPRAASSVKPGIDREARQGLLAPAAAPSKPETKPNLPERSVTVGDYRVVASIGRGGMGEIYLARSASVHYTGLVALKVLGLDDSGDDDALAMFMDEAAIMAQIDHPNVLRVVDFGRARGRHFLAMEYLEGRPLVRVMIDAYQRDKGLDYGVIAAIGRDAAWGLSAAHDARSVDGVPLHVVHRDVSPQNIFVTYPGLTKVLDFGVARATQRVAKTAVGVVKGKAAYMSPEQTEGKEVDARSDVFSLGICLWEMTAGRRLFKRETEYETLLAVSTAPVERPTLVRGAPNPALDRIILASLSRNRDKRTSSAAELAAQLGELAKGLGLDEPRAAVRDLMVRLFGGVAAEEKALIQKLDERVATDAEADSLRQLSGVSPRKGLKQEMTLAGAPSGLLDLDHFGEPGLVIEPRREGPPPSSAIVLKAVEAIKAEQAQSSAPRGREPSPASASAKPASSPSTRPLSSVAPPAEPRARPVSRVATGAEARTPVAARSPVAEDLETPMSSTTVDAPEPSFDESAEATIDASADGPAFPRPRAPLDGRSPIGAAEPGADVRPDERAGVRADDSITTKRPALVRGLRWLDPSSGARRLLSVVGVAAGLFAVGLLAFAVGRAGDDEPVPADAPAKNGPQKRPMSLPPVALTDDEPIDDDLTTATISVRELLEAVAKLGLSVTPSQGSFVVTDRAKGSVVLDEAARVTRLEGRRVQGWIIEATRRGLTRVSWIGALDGAPVSLRALSVNDCAAAVRVGPEGVVLTYGRHEVELPHGGGMLGDVSIERPGFATRLEVEPLGLAFGKRSATSTASQCSTGWWGGQVVLRSLPVGRYTLWWSGGDRRERADLELEDDEVRGARLVRTSSSAR
jgi:serine/threonine protein kinase